MPDGNLTFSNLSSLLAAARIMKKLKLKADDYIILTNLTGIDVSNAPADTLAFVEAVQAFTRSPLKAADVKFMLQHEAANLADREIKDDKILLILEKLQKEYQANFATNRSLFTDSKPAQDQQEPLQNVLSKLQDVGEEDVKTFLGFIERDWTSPNDAKTFTDTKLSGLFDTAAIKAAIDTLAAAPGPDISTEQLALVKVFLDSIAAFQLATGKQTILETMLVTTFKADPELVKVVLTYARLKQPAPGTSLLAAILSTDTLIDTDITHVVPVLPVITPAAFPDQYRALKLSHKLFPLINAFNLESQQVAWFFQNNNALGWFEWDSIPYEAGQVPINYTSYIAFATFIDLLNQLSPVPNPADAEQPISFFTIAAMLLPASGATRDQFLEAFSLLTGYDKEEVDAIDAFLFPVFDLNQYKDAETWTTVIDLAEQLRKLGITVAQVQDYIKPVLTSAEATLLRTALKARYDEDTWLSTFKEIMNVISGQKKRCAGGLVTGENPDMKTENDLFDYFLVDVEMGSCMPSSRIVQAHGAIQLFVQRCLMGLEPKAAADVNNDRAWEQWKWMKNYRVWEANRKVFVYPENWIEGELRDDKSFLFTELENEIQQNELTDFTAEQALVRYLEKLDNIAFLEVMATWYQSDISTMHVFARTKGGDPGIYYYRRFEKERYWTPWEKVELDISGDHLLAFVRNNRLCLAWPIFSEEPDPNPQSTIPVATAGTVVNNDKPKRKLKIQLAISEFANKKWQPKKLSKEGILTPPPNAEYTFDENLLRRDIYNLMYFEPGQQIWLFSTTIEELNINLKGIFNIAGCKGYPELAFQGEQYLPDFFPDFKDTWLKSQRYNEQDKMPGDELTVLQCDLLFWFL